MSHCLFFYGVWQLETLIFFFLINSFFEKDNFNVYNNKLCKWTEFCLLSGLGKTMTKEQYTIDRVGDWSGIGHLFRIWISDSLDLFWQKELGNWSNYPENSVQYFSLTGIFQCGNLHLSESGENISTLLITLPVSAAFRREVQET